MMTHEHDPADGQELPFGLAFEFEQALASARIEGFEPDEEFNADYAALAEGRISGQEFLARLAAHLRRGNADGPTSDGGEAA